MPKWKITGADKITAEDREISVDAPDADEAKKVASQLGLLVEDVSPVPKPTLDYVASASIPHGHQSVKKTSETISTWGPEAVRVLKPLATWALRIIAVVWIAIALQDINSMPIDPRARFPDDNASGAAANNSEYILAWTMRLFNAGKLCCALLFGILVVLLTKPSKAKAD